MRLINADALINRIVFHTDWPVDEKEAFEDEINAEPTIEPEQKKGKWVRHDEVKNVYGGICIECSECGEKYVVQYIEYEKYCRNCGADMREGEA